MNKTRNIVIGGCPRSGTTILTHLVNAHHSAYIGVELYKLDDYANFSADLFSKEKIIEKMMARFRERNARDVYIENQLNKIKSAELLGDKYPLSHRYWKNISEKLNEVIFLYIYRGLAEVKSSFNDRNNDQKDSWNVEAKNTLNYWQEAASNIVECKSSLDSHVIVVKYEDLFDSNNQDEFCSKVYSLMSKLNLTEMSKEFDKAISRIFIKSLEVSSKRKNNILCLDENEKAIESVWLPQLDALVG